LFYVDSPSCTGTRTLMIFSTTVILSALVASVVGLTLGLRVQPPPNGGSPQQRSGGSLQKRSIEDSLFPRGVGRLEYEASVPKNIDSEYRRYASAAVTSETSMCSKIGT